MSDDIVVNFVNKSNNDEFSLFIGTLELWQHFSDLHLCPLLPPNHGLLLVLIGGHWWQQL